MMSTRRTLLTFGVLTAMLVALTGVGVAQAQPAPPPANPMVSSPTYGQLSVRWETGTGGMSTDKYEIRYEQVDEDANPNTDFDTPTVVPNATSPHTIDGLMHDMRYIAQVRSVRTDEDGDTTRSMWVPDTAAIAETPSAPKLATVKDVEAMALDGGALVSWTAIADPTGEALHHYKIITTTEAGVSLTTPAPGDMTEFTVMGLENDVEHEVTVQAVPVGPDGMGDAVRASAPVRGREGYADGRR